MYRYSPVKYTEALFSRGSIRIGTLHDFRSQEHKRGISDPREGTKKVSHEIGLAVIDSGDHLEAKAAEAFGVFSLKGGGSHNIILDNVKFSRTIHEPDLFILCSSGLYSSETMAEFEGADSCYQITDSAAFYAAITETINYHIPVVFRGVHEVIYQDRVEQWNRKDWGQSPAIIKETEFTKQAEMRAIWQPVNTGININPLLISNQKLIELCQRMPDFNRT